MKAFWLMLAGSASFLALDVVVYILFDKIPSAGLTRLICKLFEVRARR